MNVQTQIDSHIMATVDPIILATDWQGNDVYEGDEVRIIDGDIVPADDLEAYVDLYIGEVKNYEPCD